MLVKEYRISLPLTVDEYRIAQLYMIQKKSREESSGEGSGVEILINEPYKDGPGGNGQYTHKIYHIGSHLPGWFRAILPKSALMVEEEAWNAYPYTKTIYRCPFVEKFSLEIETVYHNDGGEIENVFKLSDTELRSRVVDYIDIVKDPVSGSDYKKEEDPTLFVSEKTGRGPLGEKWREEYSAACKNPQNTDKAIMTAYKLCKVEFRYWGMQSKIERFIHDIGLKKTMVRAHRQAWCWQDEYHGLTIEDIRRLERQTQLALQEKMGVTNESDSENNTPVVNNISPHDTDSLISVDSQNADAVIGLPGRGNLTEAEVKLRQLDETKTAINRQSWSSAHSRLSGLRLGTNLSEWAGGSFEKLHKQDSDSDDEFFDAQENLVATVPLPADSSAMYRSSSMDLITPDGEGLDNMAPPSYSQLVESDVSSPLNRRVEQYRQLQTGVGGAENGGGGAEYTLSPTSPGSCKTSLLFLILHGGSILDTSHDVPLSKMTDLATLKATFDKVLRAHYPSMHGHVAFKLVQCPPICTEAMHLVASLNPVFKDVASPKDATFATCDQFPLSVLSLFATGSTEYFDSVVRVIGKANNVYQEFLRSPEGLGFSGQVCLIGDSVGSLLGYDALCKNNPYLQSRRSSVFESYDADNTEATTDQIKTGLGPKRQVSSSNPDLSRLDTVNEAPCSTVLKVNGACQSYDSASNTSHTPIESTDSAPQTSHTPRTYVRHSSCPASRRTSTGSTPGDIGKFEFEVSDFFMFGSPLGLVLAYRKTCLGQDKQLAPSQYLDPLAAAIGHELYTYAQRQHHNDPMPRPSCQQIYNLFYTSDPASVRIEPLLHDKFKLLPTLKLPRYLHFPLGDGQSVHVVETAQANVELLIGQDQRFTPPPVGSDHTPLDRRVSDMSVISQVSGHYDTAGVMSIANKWWGSKRIDYALYSPEGVSSFPSVALPYLLHASFWESTDAMAFILRQVVRQDYMTISNSGDVPDTAPFKPSQPREKWLRRRTTIKLKNVAPNHRANDVIVAEGSSQNITGRFMYGPLDMVSLSGEKVDIHVMTTPPGGEFTYFGTEKTDSNGRISFTIPEDKSLTQGMYPVKMVVRGDHTSVDLYLTVLPPKTETVVFSIDGSFTASVSIMGKDPKVRAGAVDVVRHWQDQGYMILYITARPDMQQRRVVAWLAQHNFPHGMVAFMDGLSADPLRQKTNYLKQLIQEAKIVLSAGYGSSKDITVYSNLNLPPEQIYIVGKTSKRHQKEANVLNEGYAAHLTDLHANATQARGPARHFLLKSCFSLPGSKRTLHKTTSGPHRGSLRNTGDRSSPAMQRPVIEVSEAGNTVVSAGHQVVWPTNRTRGLSPRPSQHRTTSDA